MNTDDDYLTGIVEDDDLEVPGPSSPTPREMAYDEKGVPLRTPFDYVEQARSSADTTTQTRFASVYARTRDPATSTRDLLLMAQTIEDQALLWLVHQELTRRDFPPRFRPMQCEYSREGVYFNAFVDLEWLAHKYPGHKVFKQRQRHVFLKPWEEKSWARSAHYSIAVNGNLPNLFIHSLDLTEKMTRDLFRIKSATDRSRERSLRTRIDKIRKELTEFADAHPDKSGKLSTEDIVQRDIQLLSEIISAQGQITHLARIRTAREGRTVQRSHLSLRLREVCDRSKSAAKTMRPFIEKK